MKKPTKIVHPGRGFNRILIIQDSAEESIGGLMLPNGDKPFKGKVMQTSKGYYDPQGALILPLSKIGDTIQYDKNAGVKLEIDDKEYLLVSEHDIYVIL